MQAKTTRAFRTISEAGEELGLQPHVLRFWESKFSDINPIKRGGGRRFYRPEDIEFLRGIKVLLHVEKHPIKDVQKLIKKSGAARVIELGRSIEKAATERDITETNLVPDRIDDRPDPVNPETGNAKPVATEVNVEATSKSKPESEVKVLENPSSPKAADVTEMPKAADLPPRTDSAPVITLRRSDKADATDDPVDARSSGLDRDSIAASLAKLETLRARWAEFASSLPEKSDEDNA